VISFSFGYADVSLLLAFRVTVCLLFISQCNIPVEIFQCFMTHDRPATALVCVSAVVCCVQLRHRVVLLMYTVPGLDMFVLVMPCVWTLMFQ